MGYRGRAVVSVLTNALGGVPAASDSLTAFAGPILPVVFLILLVPRRGSYFLLYPAHEWMADSNRAYWCMPSWNHCTRETSFVFPRFSARTIPRSESAAITLWVFSLDRPASFVMYFCR